MTKYKYKGIVYNVPTKASDVSLGQFLDIAQAGQNVDALFILSKLISEDVELLNNVDDFEFQALLMAQTGWVADMLTNCMKARKHTHIKFEGRRVKLPESFGVMTLGQRMLIIQASEEYDKGMDYKLFVSKCLSIFLGPSIDDSWDKDLEHLRQVLLTHECTPLMQCAAFFLSKQKSITVFGITRLSFQKIATRIKQKLRSLKNLG